ncbi:hypothetical protein [Ornithinimicrobium tianjinense]|uniref:Uncharacterized protein n=1 Tax=Ornithinimicrobium tianjinense TaxID=1195761 RepID=A0A917BQA8_9MICO|nr:hypothetical protein [Ornithinimicrobium tianjinense]GGF53198.1 hypothetical protein GCM10011366_21220 [Ornithinimicrobium tianjinense]
MPAEPSTDPGAGHRITLLGPQRKPRLRSVVRGLGLTGGHFATITAGWRDREAEDEILVAELGGRTTNLGLWSLMQQVWEIDPELEAADRERRAVLGEMQELYLIGLEQAADGLRRLVAQPARHPEVQELAIRDAVEIMRRMDARHLSRVDDVHREFYATYRPQDRDHIVNARFAVGRALAGTDAVVMPGGHVGVLLGALHLFNLAPALASPVLSEDGETLLRAELHRPIIAWGAGAMALTERVLLFFDDSALRAGVSEMLMKGLGLTRDVVALPSPRARLDLKDTVRMGRLAARVAPAQPLLLDERAEVTLDADGRLPAGAPVVGPDGTPTIHRREVGE